MDTKEFLTHVLPLTGPYVIAVDWKNKEGRKGYKHFGAIDIEEAAAIARHLDKEGRNVFFGVGALINGKEWDAVKQKWRVPRTGDNIRAVRSYIIDIDVGGPNQYASVEEAIIALRQFVKTTGLPRPTIVSSGGGLHVYWPLDEEVPQADWERKGAILKELALAYTLRIDSKRTADSSSVLRVVGTHNYKYEPAPKVHVLFQSPVIPAGHFHSILQTRAPQQIILPPTQQPDFGNNTTRFENVPLDFRKGVEQCHALAYTVDPENQAKGRDAIPEPAWLQAMMFARHAHKGKQLAHLISKYDPRYNAAYIDQKFEQLSNIGPCTCAGFQEAYANVGMDKCNGCAIRGKVTSVASVSHYLVKASPLVVQETSKTGALVERTIPDPPAPFIRLATGIAIDTTNAKGLKETLQFCDYDMYPTRLRYDERTLLEDDVRWRVKMPQEDWIEIDVPHGSTPQLRTTLAKRGVYVDENYVPHMAKFMSSYMRRLQSMVPREMAFAKLGWRKDGSFVVGDTLYKPDGTSEIHGISHALERATEFGMVLAGDYEAWRDAVRIYARPGLQAYRAYLYSTFSSVFYHMTGQIATCISASGTTGVGKTTLMDVCASVWGDPTKLMVRGAKDLSTRAAAEVRADGMHHLPVWMDEVTARDAKDVAELIFNYSGGKGKIRSTAAGGIRPDTATWSNLLLVNANTDEYERISSVFRDSAQHLMRLVQLEFASTEVITKAEGDRLRQIVHEHFGHAGRVFAEHIAQHYASIKQRVLAANVAIDKKVEAKSEERFWTAWIACNQVAAEIVDKLGILPGFPITADVQWMCDQITVLRKRTTAQIPVAGELMAEFLDAQLSNTLTIGAKGSANIDNVIREPRGELNIRYEVDNATIFVSRAAFRDYCAEKNINFNRAIDEMEKKGYVRRYNVHKILGADTTFAKGKVRCIELDMDKMGEKLALVQNTPQPLRKTKP